tara:strand:+ start:222 stop:938 length:717 start_codon:yes stop_codon:yes gene_type:complete
MGNTSNIILGVIIVVGVLAYFNIIEINDVEEIRNIPDNIDIEQVRDVVDDNVDIERSRNSLGLSNEEIFEIEDEIERLINIERKKHGLQPLAGNALLRDVAYSHSLDMAENNYFDHLSLNGDEPWDRGEKMGYVCQKVIGGWIWDGISENIAMEPSSGLFGYFDKNSIPSGVVKGWMASPGHRENILTPEWVYGEIGIALSSEGTFPASTFVGAVGDDGRDMESPVLLITHNFAVCEP